MKFDKIAFMFVLAMPIGITIELVFTLLSVFMLTSLIPGYADFLMMDDLGWKIGKFLFFHVIGWVVAAKAYKNVEKEEVNLYAMQNNTLWIDKGDYVIEARVHRA